MVYPKTKLSKPIRRSIMIFLIVCFLIISPTVIMYTAGYRYDFNTRELKQTGVISINVKPTNTSVYLNEVKIDKKIPIRLSNRAPGNYTLKLNSPGYYDWQKDINVESKKTTYIKDLTLFKQALPIKIFSNLKIDPTEIIPAYSGAYFLVQTVDDLVSEILLLDNRQEKITTLLRYQSNHTPIWNWSPFANQAYIIDDDNQTIIIIDAGNPDNNKTYELNDSILSTQWSKNNNLFVQLKNQVTNLTTNENFDNISAPVWFVDENKNIWTVKQSTLTAQNGESYTIREGAKKIIEINKNFFILQFTNGFQIFKLNNNIVEQENFINTEKITYNPNTGEWLVWSEWEFWTVYPSGDISLLVRSGDKMDNIVPLDEYGVILFVLENKLSAFNPGYYVYQNLLENSTIKNVTANVMQRKIYFWGQVGNQTGFYSLVY